jgi:hypothetical protein
VDAGDVRVIRPLMHVRQRETSSFAYGCGLPVIADNCPACYEAPKERRHIKKMLAAQEAVFPPLSRSSVGLWRRSMNPRSQTCWQSYPAGTWTPGSMWRARASVSARTAVASVLDW